jgi:proteasome lid subunit RPN8/RPN11
VRVRGAIRIESAVIEAVRRHARETHPRECCGLLLADEDRICRAWPATNAAEHPTRFLIDPRDHFAALRAARAANLRVAGAYHSHPRPPAQPSPTDLAEANDPDLLTVIIAPVGTNGAEVRAFYIDRRNFREVPIVPVP